MDNTVATLELNFTGADGLNHTFRIQNLRTEVTAAKADAALADLSQIGAFANEFGDYYQTPVDAVLITTTTKTITTR